MPGTLRFRHRCRGRQAGGPDPRGTPGQHGICSCDGVHGDRHGLAARHRDGKAHPSSVVKSSAKVVVWEPDGSVTVTDSRRAVESSPRVKLNRSRKPRGEIERELDLTGGVQHDASSVDWSDSRALARRW